MTFRLLGFLFLIPIPGWAGWMSSEETHDRFWLDVSLGYQMGYTELGAAYGNTGKVAQGPNLGFQTGLQRDGIFVGAETQLSILKGIESSAVAPYAGALVGGTLGARLKAWVGAGQEWLIIRSQAIPTPQATLAKVGFSYTTRSGTGLGAEMSFRTYSLDLPTSSVSAPHSSFLFKITLPLVGKETRTPASKSEPLSIASFF